MSGITADGIESESANLLVEFEVLSLTHKQLRDELAGDTDGIRDDPKRQTEFVNRVDGFLHELGDCVPRVKSTVALEIVDRMASDWQTLFTSILRLPKNVYQVINVGRVPAGCEPTLGIPRPLSRESVEERIRERAYDVSQKWRLSWLSQLWHELQDHPERILSKILVPPPKTSADDWNVACAYFACEVLDGQIDFAIQLSADAFDFLQRVWFEDVKKLKAFLIWEAEGSQWTPDCGARHYREACLELHNRLMDSAFKSGPEGFILIAEWLESEICVSGKLDVAKSRTQSLIREKALRLWERTGREDAKLNWLQAERFVRNFYEHLPAAIMRGDSTAMERIISSISACHSEKSNCEIVNALEAAILTYFFDPASMKAFFDQSPSYL